MKILLLVAGVVIVSLGLGYVLQEVSSIPDVEFSVSSDKCVKVVEYGPRDSTKRFTCENLPEKYTKIWVK